MLLRRPFSFVFALVLILAFGGVAHAQRDGHDSIPVWPTSPTSNSSAPVSPTPQTSNYVAAVQGMTYAQVIGGNVPVYQSPTDAAAGIAPERWLAAGFVFVSLAGTPPVNVLGENWYTLNPEGYISAKHIAMYAPSVFHGIALEKQPDKPFAWVLYDTQISGAPGGPPAQGAPRLSRYTVVTVYEEKPAGGWTWYRIGQDQWIEQRRVAVLKVSPRPAEIGPSDKWIEVNLYEQTLAAYEGDRLVYATLASTGLPYWWTQTGLFRVWAKVGVDKMSGRDGLPDYYYLEDVPWILYFNHDTALHGAYWHDGFGAPHSHGCVNLSPADAMWLYQWATPVPQGGNWTISSAANPGTWVWVHA